MSSERQLEDGNCLFYSLLQNNNCQLAQDLRNDMASWIGANPMYMVEGMAVELWISHQFLRGSTLSIPTYSKSLRSTLQGGELEIQVFAECSRLKFLISILIAKPSVLVPQSPL